MVFQHGETAFWGKRYEPEPQKEQLGWGSAKPAITFGPEVFRTLASRYADREYAHLLNSGTIHHGTCPGETINVLEDIQSPAGWSIARHDQHLICRLRRR